MRPDSSWVAVEACPHPHLATWSTKCHQTERHRKSGHYIGVCWGSVAQAACGDATSLHQPLIIDRLESRKM